MTAILRRLWALTLLLLSLSLPAPAQQVLGGLNNASAPPVSSIGSETDWFFDFASGRVYGPKTSNRWPASPVAVIPNLSATSVPFGTSLIPVNLRPAQSHYDPTSAVLTNSLGANLGLFGSAAIDTTPTFARWWNAYTPGQDAFAFSALSSVSPVGHNAGYFAVRSSDNTVASTQSVISLWANGVADRSTQADFVWPFYSSGYYVNPTQFELLDEITNSNVSGTPSPFLTPYLLNSPGQVIGLRVDTGTNVSPFTNSTASVALSLTGIAGAQFHAGIVFDQSLLETSTNAQPDAISFPTNYALAWYQSNTSRPWVQYMDSTALLHFAANATQQIQLSNTSNLQLQFYNTGAVGTNIGQIGSDSSGVFHFRCSQQCRFETGTTPRITIPNTGQIEFQYPPADQSLNAQTTGSSYPMTNTDGGVVLSGSVSSPYTVTAPAAPVDGQSAAIYCAVSLGSLTFAPNSGQTVLGGTTSCAATPGSSRSWRYVAALTSWVPR